LFFAVSLLLVLSRRKSFLAAFMRLGFLRDIGGVSYCIYIIHTAVFLFFHQILLGALPAVTDGKAAGVTLLAALATYGIAKLSWRFFEQPLLRRGHAFRYDSPVFQPILVDQGTSSLAAVHTTILR